MGGAVFILYVFLFTNSCKHDNGLCYQTILVEF